MDLQKSSTDDKTTPQAKVESGESVDSLGPLPPRTLSNANNDMLKSTNSGSSITSGPSSPGASKPAMKHARFNISRMRSTSQSSNDDAGANAGNGGLRERSDTVEKKEKHARFSVQATTQEQDPALSSGGDDSATTAEIDTSPSSPEPPGVATDTDNDETHQKTHGSQTTHWTYMNKSLRRYITEALPRESNYRNILSIGQNGADIRKYSRPTLGELHNPEEAGKLLNAHNNTTTFVSKDPEAPKEETEVKGKVVKFGWLDGVYMRCLLNIWGVMLFLRLTWVVGQAGLIQGLLVITLANIVTVITAISMSAVSTNGQIKGGGIYYMISRSLGPEFGGAIGIMFTIANSIAVSMYTIGFCDSLLDMLYEYIPGFTGVVSENRTNDIRLIGTITVIAVLLLAVVGMDWVTRVQLLLLVLLIVSQFDFVIGSFFPDDSEKKFGFLGWDNATELFKKNADSEYHNYQDESKTPSFFAVFGVFFPAVTGIVAGANLSGDLKDPGTAIPKGTLLAIATTYVTYIVYGVVITGVSLRDASGVQEEFDAYIYNNATLEVPAFNDCANRTLEGQQICEYGSANDQQMMAKISYTGYLIFAGCFAATLSSAIASLVGAPRVLQALAKDNLYPGLKFFSAGYGANNDPFRGYALVFVISTGCILIAELDAVSALLSNFFVAAYALINFSVFHASITKSPGWRPSFKYYSPWVSLLGAILCIAVMFLIQWYTALATFIIVGVLYFYISYRKPEANWGSSTQAQQFVLTLKNLQSLNDVPDHVKNYRPKVLVFSGIPAHRQPLVDFANLITKKLSLLICSHIETDAVSSKSLTGLKSGVEMWLKDHGIKAFFTASQNKSFSDGAISCMNLAGLGKLTPNMVLMGFKADWASDPEGAEEYINVMHHAFDINMAMGVLRMSNGCDFSSVIGREEQIFIGANDNAGKSGKGDHGGEDHSSDGGDDNKEIVTTSGLVVEKTSGTKGGTSKASVAVYHGVDGAPLSKSVVADITQFQAKKRKGTIDVWWLYDDGGLTLLLPYILTTRSQFSDCSLRVFTLANRRDELDRETRNMISLLSKFRIDYSDVTVIPDVTKKAKESTKAEFDDIMKGLEANNSRPSEAEMAANREKTNRHLRLSELLREHSANSEMVIMTLPMPRRGATPPAMYLSWLDIMTRKMPPFLLLRGNQTSVLTFYS